MNKVTSAMEKKQGRRINGIRVGFRFKKAGQWTLFENVTQSWAGNWKRRGNSPCGTSFQGFHTHHFLSPEWYAKEVEREWPVGEEDCFSWVGKHHTLLVFLLPPTCFLSSFWASLCNLFNNELCFPVNPQKRIRVLYDAMCASMLKVSVDPSLEEVDLIGI